MEFPSLAARAEHHVDPADLHLPPTQPIDITGIIAPHWQEASNRML
jgi:hypothetical protein